MIAVRELEACPAGQRQSANTPRVKRLLIIFATLVAAVVICVLCIGWLLAHPVQRELEILPPTRTLNRSFSHVILAQMSMAGGVQLRMLAALSYFCPVFARIV